LITKNIITLDDARSIASGSKSLHGALAWHKRDNHAGFLIASARVEDADGAFLPGLTVEFEYKAGISLARCQFLFTLFTLRQGAKLRAYQLEISPPEKRTHNETGNIIYGTHEHWGDKAIALSGFGCDDYTRGFAHFCQQINLTADLPPLQQEIP